jgi:predicted cupin superfamily sugar epimerase
MQNAEYWIQHLSLLPHPEGGFYKEIFRSNLEILNESLPYGFKGARRLCTSIYYLLRAGEISRLHRLKADELWYYHIGSSIKIYMIDQEGHKQVRFLGPKIEKAEQLQIVIPAGTIFGAELTNTDSYSLFGCLVSPGFEFEDFELFKKEDLLQAYPKHSDIIEKFA